MSRYAPSSPYYTTPVTGNFLDLMNNRPIPKYNDDQLFVISQVYQYRPDLLAHDLYGNAGLWWVFAQRNPNELINPLLDFAAGKSIYLPKIETLQQSLGI
jgi:hypothetical protein